MAFTIPKSDKPNPVFEIAKTMGFVTHLGGPEHYTAFKRRFTTSREQADELRQIMKDKFGVYSFEITYNDMSSRSFVDNVLDMATVKGLKFEPWTYILILAGSSNDIGYTTSNILFFTNKADAFQFRLHWYQ